MKKAGERGRGFYVVIVSGDVEPSIKGPYQDEATRDRIARHWYHRGNGKDSVFALDIRGGVPYIWAYSNEFMEDNHGGNI